MINSVRPKPASTSNDVMLISVVYAMKTTKIRKAPIMMLELFASPLLSLFFALPLVSMSEPATVGVMSS